MSQEILWTHENRYVTCTVCQETSLGSLIAVVKGLPIDGLEVVRCSQCQSIYLLDSPLDFSGTAELVDEYIESAAGLDAILRGVQLANSPGVRSFLDVGSNVGFAMDMGRFFYGWDVTGVEPSLAGHVGVAELGLTIYNEYLTPQTTLPQKFDTVFASEVLEHVPSPSSFLAAIRAHLVPEGQIVLTTPAAEVVSMDELQSDVIAALSSGFHCFIASQQGLELLLERAGFVDVNIVREGGTLRASACAPAEELTSQVRRDVQGADINIFSAAPPKIESYLRYRVDDSVPGSALECGMLVRLLSALTARGAFAETSDFLPTFYRGFALRHKINLRRPLSIRPRSRRLRAALPFIAMPNYALAMYELLSARNFPKAIAHFDLAENAIRSLERQNRLVRPDSYDVLRHIPFHRFLAQAHVAPLEAARTLMESGLTTAQKCRIFVEIVGQGFFDVPGDVVEAVSLAATKAVSSQDSTEQEAGLDAFFQLGIVAAYHNDFDRARSSFRNCIRASEEAQAEGAPPADVHTAAIAQLEHLPSPPSHHMIDTYWRDAWGVYIDGWIHLEDVPIESIHVVFGEASVEADRHVRSDLLPHWPAFPTVVEGGFRAYVAGGHGSVLTVTLETSKGTTSTIITLPDHPLPVQPEQPLGVEFELSLRARIAAAPPGPVLAIGMRSVSEEQAAERLAIFGNREVVRVDIHPGPGVDIVGDAHVLSQFLPVDHFAVVYSSSVLEHLTKPWIMAAECSRVLILGGLSIHKTPWTWPTHSQPNDFYRFSPGGLAELFSPQLGFEIVELGELDGAVVTPTPPWRNANVRLPTHVSASSSWISARKISEPMADKVWDYLDEGDGHSARRYPLDGLMGENK
jgi:SAM-dependent methyltransferase